MGIGADALVDGQDHLQAVVALGAQLTIDLPHYVLDAVELGLRDALARAAHHGQVDGQVVPFDEREERRLDEPASDEAWHGDEEQGHDGAERDPRLVQGEAQHRSIEADAQEAHDAAHAAFHRVGLEVPAQRLAVPYVGRQDERPLDEAEQQRQHDDRRHVAEEVAEPPLYVEERRKRDHGRDDGREHRGQHLHCPLDGGGEPVFAHLVVPVDVLRDDDAVVHEDANHEDHAEEADDVNGDARCLSEDEHARERHRDGQGHPEGEADVEEEGE